MSHFDDVDVVVFAGPAGFVGLLIIVAAIIWSVPTDSSSMKDCESHGEKYIDSQIGYTLCEQDGGTVVRR